MMDTRIKVYQIISRENCGAEIVEGKEIDISDEELIRLGKRFLELISKSRPKGKWGLKPEGNSSWFKSYHCSICGEKAPYLWEGDRVEFLSDYCPYCGADMRGEE